MTLLVEGLTVARGGRTVVRGVDLRVDAGEVVCLLGPNGAGRSSTILALAGLLPCEASTLSLKGVTIAGARPDAIRRAGMSTVLENHRVLTDLTVADNLRVAGGRRGAERDKRVDDVLATFPELVEHLDRPAGRLSGGQQQMLALGQALASEPDIVVIDEMSMGLAPVVVGRLLGLMRELAGRGIGVLLVEQFAHLALGVSDRAYVMARGHIGYDGSAAALLDDQRGCTSSTWGWVRRTRSRSSARPSPFRFRHTERHPCGALVARDTVAVHAVRGNGAEPRGDVRWATTSCTIRCARHPARRRASSSRARSPRRSEPRGGSRSIPTPCRSGPIVGSTRTVRSGSVTRSTGRGSCDRSRRRSCRKPCARWRSSTTATSRCPRRGDSTSASSTATAT